MANENSGLPDDILQALDRASRLAAAIDKAITAAVPDIVDLQVLINVVLGVAACPA